MKLQLSNYFVIFFLFFFYVGFSQKDYLYSVKTKEREIRNDRIINYIGKKDKIVPKEKAFYYEVLSKINDSLWRSEKYYKDLNKLYRVRNFTSKDKEVQTGEETVYSLKGNITWERYHDKGKKIGSSTRWFDNGKVDFTGKYKEGKQQGSWKFYHTNGELAVDKIYVKGVLMNETFYDVKGVVLPEGSFVNRKEKAFFKGGREKYYQKISGFKYKLSEFLKERKISYKFKGKLVVMYIIGVEGRITDVFVNEYLPNDIKEFIVKSFKGLKGWNAASYLNRKVPFLFTQRISLNVNSKKD